MSKGVVCVDHSALTNVHKPHPKGFNPPTHAHALTSIPAVL